MLTTLLKRIVLLLALPSLGLLYGCNDGGDSASSAPDTTTAQTLSGTAATGMPIVSGNVMVVCAGGPNLSTQTSVDGTWTVTLSGQTLPCAVQASGGTVNGIANAGMYHSIALNFGTVNITPLTDLVVANLVGQVPSAWFNGLNGASLGQTATTAAINTALANLRNALASVDGMAALANVNPMTTTFTAVGGNPIDDMLEAFQAALANAGITYLSVVTQAANGATFTVDLPRDGNPGDTDPSATGDYTLTLTVTYAGMTTIVTFEKVPKPSTESEFCSEVNDPSSAASVSSALDGMGTYTIDSCSFNGMVGNVTATLTITSPVSMTVPYTVVYTYSD